MPPLLDNKNPTAKSVFAPAALLREARRQKGLAATDVPPICILDPDGDIVRRLKASGESQTLPSDWPCYHTELCTFALGRKSCRHCWLRRRCAFCRLGGGATFRQRLSTADQHHLRRPNHICWQELPYFVVIDRALRDEGTSYH